LLLPFLLGYCSWLPPVFHPLVLGGQEEATALQLCLLPSLGDVGFFMLKLVEGLQGHTWAPDWAEELREADRQKEQTYRWACVEWTWEGAFPAGIAVLLTSFVPVAGRRQRCL
jgi:hypothetical protein